LYEEGYRGVIFDIDNTLVPHGAPADDRDKKTVSEIRKRLDFPPVSFLIIKKNE